MSSNSKIIDLRSDTVTKPTKLMKEAMVAASLGDDVLREDPTVIDLERKVAGLMGKEDALFVTSGTMANLIAVMVHCNKRGSEMLCGDLSHVYKREGAIANITRVLVSSLKNNADGTFDLLEVEKRIRGKDIHEPITMLVSIENTHSFCGGKVLPLNWIENLSFITKKHDIALHMDGARLMNASIYLREDLGRLTRDCDSVSICFSKGLGAPIGSALSGTKSFIDQARRCRKALGGGMRQAGVIAAAAIVALDYSPPLMVADHHNAHMLAKAVKDLNLTRFSVDLQNQHTNIVHVKIPNESNLTSDKVKERLATVTESEDSICTSDGKGIVIQATAKPDNKTLRFVLHFDVHEENLVVLAIKKLEFVLREFEKDN